MSSFGGLPWKLNELKRLRGHAFLYNVQHIIVLRSLFISDYNLAWNQVEALTISLVFCSLARMDLYECLKNVLLKLSICNHTWVDYLGIKLFYICSIYNITFDVHVMH